MPDTVTNTSLHRKIRHFVAKAVLLTIALLWTASLGADPLRCLPPPFDAPESHDQNRLAKVYQTISPVLAIVLDISNQQPAPALCLAEYLDGAEGYFDPDAYQIVLRSSLSDDFLSGLLLHEFRHVKHYWDGRCPANLLSMQENARSVLAMEADASAVSLMAAWQLRTQGNPDVWAALSTWQSQRDIADRLDREMHQTGDITRALEAAFDQWYRSETRTTQYYIASCSEYLDRQDNGKLLPSYRMLPGDFFNDLCTLPSGGRYSCAEPTPAP